MSISRFIFSKQTAPRLERHLAFWGMYVVCFILTDLPPIGYWTRIRPPEWKVALLTTLEYLPVYLLSVYCALYIMLPVYLKHRNGLFLALYMVCSLLLSILAGYFITQMIFTTNGYGSNKLDILSMALQRCMADTITITGAALIVKILKDYYLERRENDKLTIENIRSKIQCQKIQLHPRILFGSLHKIQTEIDARSKLAPELILKLSDLLSYLLYESDTDRVLLSEELSMVKNYIALKQLEYKETLDIRLQIGGQQGDQFISPGILLPLLEIGIERSGDLTTKARVTIELRTAGKEIYFSMKNNLPGNEVLGEPFVQSTIDSVKERLRSAYNHKFKFEVLTSNYSFAIILQLAKGKTVKV